MKRLLRVAALIMFSSAFVHAQTVADLARKERARQQNNTKKTVVITNENVKSGAPNTGGEAPAPATTTPAPASAAATSLPGGHDEKWWREQFENARDNNQRLEAQIPVLEANLNKANFEFLTRSYDPDGRGKRAIDDSKQALDQAKSDLAKGQERIAQLEEDLRRAGGPPGWSR